MRKLVSLLFVVAIAMASVVGVTAQDADGNVGSGTYTDDRGNQVATLEVTGVEAGWSDYADNGAPARGYEFHAVHFTITNVSDIQLDVNDMRFSMVDSLGLNSSRKNVRLDETAETNVLTDSFSLAAGESQEATLVFELFSDVSPALFMWQPDSGSLVMVDVSDGSAEESAVANGLNAPAFFGDERGNLVGSIELLEIEEDWRDFQEFYGPDRGMRHVAVHFRVTNLADTSIEVNPFNISLLDSESANNGRSSARAEETAEIQVTTDRVDVAPGESFEGMLVYTLYDGVEPAALIWQPEYGVITAVILNGEDSGTEPIATPEENDDENADATPAA